MLQLCLVISLGLSFGSISANNVNEGENVALRKPVLVNGKWGHCLTDGNFHTTVAPIDDIFPMVSVDLLDVYELSSIRIHAQNEWSFGDAGLNIPFSVHVWANFTATCDMSVQYPWTLIKSNLTFTRKGEEIVLQGPIEAQYIIVLPDRRNEFTKTGGLTMGELRAFGKKIRDGYRPETFDEDPELINEHTEIRHQLLSGQQHLYVDPSYGEYQLSPKHVDVALCWYDYKISTMAVRRGNAHVIVTSGTEGTKRMLHYKIYDAFRINLKHWLSPNGSDAKFVGVSKRSKAGDILMITRDDKFDVNDIYQKLSSGMNSAIISYTGSSDDRTDDATSLMANLEIKYVRHSKRYAGRNIPLDNVITTNDYIPISYRLKLGLRSWKYFKTFEYVTGYSEAEVRTPEVQDIVEKTVKRYLNIFKYHSVCELHSYKKNPDTDTALVNYNRILMLQRGNTCQTAPGFSRAPGQIHPSSKPTNYNVTFNVDVWGNYFPMGGYAKPGEAFRYRVINVSRSNLNGFGIRINPQTDYVAHVDGMRRWPTVTMYWDMKMQDQLVSPFGGPIVVKIPADSSISIEFENVYRYPWFDSRNPDSEKNWESERNKHKGVPYLMIMGDNMISMLETPTIIKMKSQDIKWATTHFDNMVKIMHNYRGSSHEQSRIEVFVTDDQISAGYGHSGYPWMGYRDWVHSFAGINSIKQGHNIGYPHEVGHNLQVGGMTFVNGGEVTNNMYIPVVHKYLLGLHSFEKGGVPGYRDCDITQLIENWENDVYIGVKESYYTFFGRYFSPALVGNVIHLVTSTKEPLNTEERKVNFWITNMCNESGYNLVPFHRLWHFPILDATVEACATFPCWFPDDEVTQRVPDLISKVKAESKTQCSADKPKEVAYKFDLMYGIDKTKKQSIFFQI